MIIHILYYNPWWLSRSDFERTWWRLFQKIWYALNLVYVFIIVKHEKPFLTTVTELVSYEPHIFSSCFQIKENFIVTDILSKKFLWIILHVTSFSSFYEHAQLSVSGNYLGIQSSNLCSSPKPCAIN